jgi:hypothetical protein
MAWVLQANVTNSDHPHSKNIANGNFILDFPEIVI